MDDFPIPISSWYPEITGVPTGFQPTMASVCGASLALMGTPGVTAGSAPVAGIAHGLAPRKAEKFAILTALLVSDEDQPR